MKHDRNTEALLAARFGKDSLIALATASREIPSVRAVNAIYENGAFYVITHARSGKMQHIRNNPTVGLCGEWFTGHAHAENLGHVRQPCLSDLASRLRAAFSAWYDNGHVDETDPDTIILRLKLTDGVLFDHGNRYEFEF